MPDTEFDDLAARKIGWYVYTLRDPRNNRVFYVGKGVENRWFDHIKEARAKINEPKLKLQPGGSLIYSTRAAHLSTSIGWVIDKYRTNG